MNRIIIIGNGFDRAHNLRTGYREFMDDYWYDFAIKTINTVGARFGTDNMIKSYTDGCVSIEVKNEVATSHNKSSFSCNEENPYNKLFEFIEKYNKRVSPKNAFLSFENKFFEQISNQCALTNWLDIENEYYNALKKLLLEEDSRMRNQRITKLNREFEDVKNLLEKHLTHISENTKIETHQSIQDAFSSFIKFDDIATNKQLDFVNSIFSEMNRYEGIDEFEEDKRTDPEYNILNTKDEEKLYYIEKSINNIRFKHDYCFPHTLILNFNYTKIAEKLYSKDISCEIINIHGELNSMENPIIFGYGDELDDDYAKIERLQDNAFLENIKSIKYHQTRNYRDLLKFIKSGIYQVFVMGHSCGNSDRTLLNTLFEHENCVSIKVYYRQHEDGSDDYSNLIRNISRNFNDKPNMRDIVVNWKNCSPLVPCKKQN